MRFFLMFLALISCVCALRADLPETGGFSRGNALYAEGKYTAAVTAYEAAARRGEYSANLFYNLADAYYRLGDRGRAILNYQRALLLEPRHAEAAANLAFVRGRAPAPTAVTDEGLTGWLDLNTWIWVATVGGWLAVVGLAVGACQRRWRQLTLPVGLVGLASTVVAGWAIYRLDGGSGSPVRAVVLADETRALYSPADNSKEVSVLPVGGEVRVLSEQGAWDYVQLGDGSRGWVASDRVEKVVPPAARRSI